MSEYSWRSSYSCSCSSVLRGMSDSHTPGSTGYCQVLLTLGQLFRSPALRLGPARNVDNHCSYQLIMMVFVLLWRWLQRNSIWLVSKSECPVGEIQYAVVLFDESFPRMVSAEMSSTITMSGLKLLPVRLTDAWATPRMLRWVPPIPTSGVKKEEGWNYSVKQLFDRLSQALSCPC